MSSKACSREQVSSNPKPLIPTMGLSEKLDYRNLGPLAKAVEAIAAVTQAPEAIAMQSVLAATTVSVQHLVNVETLFGSSPTSLFFLTVGESGERKSSCDGLALAGLKKYEKEKRRAANGANAEKTSYWSDCDLIEDPQSNGHRRPPRSNDLNQKILFGDVTIEGLLRALDTNQPSVGLFTDEGGQFFGGHSMKSQNSLGSAARLSKLWDAGEVDLIRATADPIELYGRRLASHLMVQPKIARDVFSDVTLKDQGFMSRCLPAWPESTIGSRYLNQNPKEADDDARHQAIDDFQERCIALLHADRSTNLQDQRELEPRVLPLAKEAHSSLLTFYNRVEAAMGDDGAFSGIRGFASKAPQQAARIAAVMTTFEDQHATEVPELMMRNAIGMMKWYLNEARRITTAHIVSDEVRLAEGLRLWLTQHWPLEFITKRAIARRGPSKLRDAGRLDVAIEILKRAGWLTQTSCKVMVDGQVTRNAMRIVKGG